MQSRDDFKRYLKSKCFRGKNGSWGCPCCVDFRLIGRKNGRYMLRRHARRHLKNNDRKMVNDLEKGEI